MVLAIIVVVTHVSLVVDFDVYVDSFFCTWSATFVLDVVCVVETATVVLLSNVKLVSHDLIVGVASVVGYVNFFSASSTIDFDVKLGVFVFGWASIPETMISILLL